MAPLLQPYIRPASPKHAAARAFQTPPPPQKLPLQHFAHYLFQRLFEDSPQPPHYVLRLLLVWRLQSRSW
jgi:hypothetical protein